MWLTGSLLPLYLLLHYREQHQPTFSVAIMQPVLAVSAALVRNNHVLFVRRGNPPSAGMLALPGGKIEAGETLIEGVARELLEETGVHAKPLHVLTAVDAIHRDAAGKLRSHYVIITFLCEWLSGTERAGSDAASLVWLNLETMEKEKSQIAPHAMDVAKLALSQMPLKSQEPDSTGRTCHGAVENDKE